MANVQLHGVDELLTELRRRLQNGADRVEKKALRAGGEIIGAAMKTKVNRSDKRFIHIKDDIKVSRTIRRDGMKYVRIGPSRKTAWRAWFLENGTSNMDAHPFAYPSFHENKSKVYAEMTKEFKKGLMK